MVRGPRIDIGDHVYHVLNRGNGRAQMFYTGADYADFEYLLNEMRETYDMRILAYTIMPNHWHLLLYPRKDGDMGKALHWLTTSHVRRHHTRNKTIGHGHLYQGTYKSFMTATDRHLLTVLKYIERNPIRAKLADKPEDWKWGSAHRRITGTSQQKHLLSELPVELPKNYRSWIGEPEASEEINEVRYSVEKGTQFGVLS